MKQVHGVWLPDDDTEFAELLETVRADKYLERPYTWALKSLPEDRRRVAIDVGAHVGLASLRFSKKFPRVIALEPSPDNYECLGRNTDRVNGINCHQFAAGQTNGSCKLVTKRESSGHGFVFSVNTREVAINKTTAICCQMRSLDSIVEGYGLQAVDLLKVDVQGYELDVLLGAEKTLRQFRPTVILEEHYDNYEQQPNRAVGWLVYELGGYFVGRDKRNHVIRL